MDRTLAIVSVVLALAAGLAVGRFLPRGGGGAEPEAAARRTETLERELADLRTRLADAQAKRATLETAATPPPPAPASPPPSSATPAAPATTAETAAAMDAARAKAELSSDPRYAPAAAAEAVRAVDWAVVGKNMAEMAPMISKFAHEMATTGKYTPETIGRVQQLNGPLVTAAMKAAEKMGVQNPNVAFTHPAFMANAIAAALEAAGKPLTEGQAQSVGAAAEEFTSRETRRLASYGEGVFALKKALDESALREEFFQVAFAALTPEQREALQPPATRGRLQSDLFSPGLVWLTRSRISGFKDRDGLVADVERQIFDRVGLTDAARTAAKPAMTEWADSIPAADWQAPLDPLSQNGMVPVASVVAAATRQLALLERIVELARIDEAGSRRARNLEFVLVPVRSAGD